MDEQQELIFLRRRVAELEELLAIAKIDIEVLAFEVQALERQRAADVRRLAGIERSRWEPGNADLSLTFSNVFLDGKLTVLSGLGRAQS
jgi:hypothetical protein